MTRLPALMLCLALLLAACAGGREAAGEAEPHAHPPGTGPHTHGEVASAREGGVKPVLATSELLTGPGRFVFALVDAKSGAPIGDAPEVLLQFFEVHPNGTATKRGDAAAVYRSEGLPVGVFVTRSSFERAGKWGALLTVRPRGAKPFTVQMDFTVAADSPVPRVGETAPPSDNLTRRDVRDLNEIDSARPHDAMHDLTIKEAVRSGKPTLVLFATPGYCETATCGPDLAVAQTLQEEYAGRANFIHIETPTSERAPQAQAPTVKEWGLRSEPWLFLIGPDGRVAERFEGGLTLDEVRPAFEKLLD